ncbi:MAG TPA: ChaB family protein [Actinomycetaceae bacterium]|nr:ChaB family protein [Actinomycetaceae bacterium]
MPKMGKSGKPKLSELPDTLRRSEAKAQRTFAKAHDSAQEQYDDDERANRVAYAALKHSFEKVGDHWEEKDSAGPSDERAAGGGDSGKTAEGVDARATKTHLYDVAKRLEISGRSTMTKDELVTAIQRENRRRTRRSG